MSVIAISGGTGTLGTAMGRRFAKDHTVVLLAKNQAKLEDTAREVGAEYVVVDTTNAEEVAKSFEQILQNHGQIDVLVNTAGALYAGNIDENEPAEIEELLDVNALSCILTARAVIPSMRAVQRGLIVNVIAQSGLYEGAGLIAYRVSKSAAAAFTKNLRRALKKDNIRVSGIYPGAFGREEQETVLQVEEVVDAVEFVLTRTDSVVIPELGIQHIKYDP